MENFRIVIPKRGRSTATRTYFIVYRHARHPRKKGVVHTRWPAYQRMLQARNCNMADPSDTTELTFSARRSALEPCLHWRLTHDALHCARDPEPAAPPMRRGLRLALRVLLPWLRTTLDDRWPEHVPLREITSIRARFDPTRFDRNRYRCDLRGPDGARISIFSTHYVRPGEFDDRGDRYAAFVSHLARRAQRARPSVKLTTGLPWPSYLLQHGVLLASLIALMTMLGTAGLPLFGLIWVKLAVIAAYLGVLLRYAWVNIPQDLTLPPDADRPRHPPQQD
jgi:hypothetical protein